MHVTRVDQPNVFTQRPLQRKEHVTDRVPLARRRQGQDALSRHFEAPRVDGTVCGSPTASPLILQPSQSLGFRGCSAFAFYATDCR